MFSIRKFCRVVEYIVYVLRLFQENRNCKKKKNSAMWAQLKQMKFPKREEDNPHDEQIKQIYRLNYNLNFFCDEIRKYT